MMARGWAEFHRDLYTEFRRDGLVVDLRDTQGGDAGQLVAEKLARRIIGWNVSRYEEPSSYPADAPRGPIVAMTDEYASSGGDIVFQALKSCWRCRRWSSARPPLRPPSDQATSRSLPASARSARMASPADR